MKSTHKVCRQVKMKWFVSLAALNCRLMVAQLCKEFTCNAGDPCSIPGWGRSPGDGIGYPLQYSWAFLVAQTVKKKKICPQCGRPGFDPWIGKIPGEGHSNPLQYSCLENWEPDELQFMASQRVGND